MNNVTFLVNNIAFMITNIVFGEKNGFGSSDTVNILTVRTMNTLED